MPSSSGWTITHFCSACNYPKGSVKGQQDHILTLNPRDCAINSSHGFKFGQMVQIAGMSLRVVDSCKEKYIVDIWQGKK